MKHLAGRLRHDDVLPVNHLSCDPVWLEAFMTTMNYQEDTMYRIQQFQFGIAQTLSEIGTSIPFILVLRSPVDRRLKSSVEQDMPSH